jgi:hypothetical protein
MAISYIGSASAQSTSCTPPTHTTGDLFICAAYRDGSTTSPSLPSGWTNITNNGANTNSMRVGYKFATSASDTCTGWSNAGAVMLHVYRGVNTSTPIGVFSYDGASSSTVRYLTLGTLADTGGTSWVAGFAAHRSVDTTAMGTAPTGMTNRTNTAGTSSDFASHDTNGTVSSWGSQSVAVGGTASGWRSVAVEIRVETVPTLSGQTVTLVSGTSGTPKVTTTKASGTVYMVCVPNGDSPSVAQIKAGQRSNGTSAIASQSQAVTASGVQTFSTVTGLTTDTPYDFWFVHTNSEGDSTAVNADFTPVIGSGDFGNVWVTPTTVTDLGGSYAWSGTGNLAASDNTYATVTAPAATAANYLLVQFGLDIDAGATITGISIEVEGSVTNTPLVQFIYFTDTGDEVGIVGGASPDIGLSGTETTHTFGGAGDDWGISPTPTLVNDADFGLVVYVFGDAASACAYSLDRIRIKVHTPAAGGSNLFWAFP